MITNVMNAGQWGHLEKLAKGAADRRRSAGPSAGPRRTRRRGDGGGPPRSRVPYRKVTPEGRPLLGSEDAVFVRTRRRGAS